MEFWVENQAHPQLYSTFRTLPGRNCSNSYQDRHQATYNTLYSGEQQNLGRESSNWTVSGSRAGRALREYWTEPELPSSSSPCFPFTLHYNDRRHRDLGECRQHNPRDRELVSQGALRDYDRGLLRDPWAKRWDQSQASCYNRDVSTKRNDSSYRELEAWAARYSHSLPRRRRLQAELREAVQGLSESNWAPEREKLEINPQFHLQHGQLNANSRTSGLWDKIEAPNTCTNHVNEKIVYQPRVFSKPPGYVGPPSYSRPYKSPPVIRNCDVGWEHVGKKQANWSKPKYTKQEVPVDVQTKRLVEDLSKACPEFEELKSSEHKRDASQAASPIDAQMPDDVSAQQPQAAKISNKEKEEIFKVIEGRKFRLKKKTGGMTIFCLVSRIVSPSEAKSLPVCPSKTSLQTTGTGVLSKDTQDKKQGNDLVHDVDSRAQTPEEPSDKKTLGFREKLISEDNPSSAAKSVLEKTGFERNKSPSEQLLLTKYPLWREPCASNKTDTETSNTTCLKETEGGILNQDEGGDVTSHSADNDMKNVEIKENAEDMRGLFVIDTSCVVVKVEMIPSPKKEQVHYLGSTANNESSSSDLNSKLYQDVTTGPSDEALKRKEDPEADPDSTPLNKLEHKDSDVSYTSSLSEKETLAERAERILGINLHDADIKENSEDEEPLCKERKKEGAESHPAEQMPEDTVEQVQVPLVGKGRDEIGKQLTDDGGKDFTEFQTLATIITEDSNTEFQRKTDDTLTQNELKEDDGDESKKEEQHVNLNCSFSVPLNLLDPSIHEGPDSELEEQSPVIDLTPSPPGEPPPLFPKSPDSPSSEDHLPSPPPLEEIFMADDVETKDDEAELLHLAESELNNKSLVTEIEEVLPHQDNDCPQRDDAPFVSVKQETDEGDCSTEETTYGNPNLLAQPPSCDQSEGVTCAKHNEDHQLAEIDLSDPTVQISEKEDARRCETAEDGIDLEEDVLSEKERDETLEQSRINPDLIANLSAQRQSSERTKFTQAQAQTDTLQNLDPQREFIDYSPPLSSSSEVRNELFIAQVLPDRDYFPLLETDSTVSLLNVEVTAAPNKENPSDPFYPQSCEESSQLTGSQYSKSLLDVVNRIRKHTAPDSESEEEEVSEGWDPSCLDMVVDLKSGENFDELQTVFKDSAETSQCDQDHKESEEHAVEDTMSCGSISHIVGIETRPSGDVDEEKEESETAEGELRCSSEDKGESQVKESKEDQTTGGSGEESPVDVDQDATEV